MTRLRLAFAAVAAAGLAALSGCVAPIGPVEVTRFHTADIAALGSGTVAIEPAAGIDPASPEWQAYRGAVARQLTLLGYREAPAGSGAHVASVAVTRQTLAADGPGPVSVGVGGSTGTYGSGVGLGLGLNLSPKPGPQVATDLAVAIRLRGTGAVLWEGRARFVVAAKSPLAQTSLGAAKMAEALFRDFPGQSGQTIEVR